MTDMIGADIRASFKALLADRLNWLRWQALPLWARAGVDPAGGFYEAIDQQNRPVLAGHRRARVVARQTFVFATATARGWGDYSTLAAHGIAELFDRCLLSSGLSLTTYAADGSAAQHQFDAYDQAFVLFALASVACHLPEHRVRALAAGERLLAAMQANYRHPVIGFEEPFETRQRLLQNPHMHLLEACLAFAKVPGTTSIWLDQARQLVDLAQSRLVDRQTGAIHEFFDRDWQPIVPAESGPIEPGHQFEWAWLLWQWHDAVGDRAADVTARRLYDIGEGYGRTAAGQVIDALDARLSPQATTLRLWPQTERLRCCVAAAERSDHVVRDHAISGAIEALNSLEPYFATPVPGLWADRLTAQGQPIDAPSPASSLYHIVGALDYADRFAGAAA